MSEGNQETPTENKPNDKELKNKPTDKELNFRALENKLQQERNARYEAERKAQELERNHESLMRKINSSRPEEDDDDDDEPFVDHKKLKKQFGKFGEKTKTEIQLAMEEAKKSAKEELKREMWIEQNPDFVETLKYADKFAEKAPKLAESILRMPEGFERQVLVYNNIKALGLDKSEVKEPSIQDKINSNRRGAFYQPSGIANAPYSSHSDFSPNGQKQAYEKMQELKSRLRLG
jgi:hypothetical protein